MFPRKPQDASRDFYNDLTNREREVLHLLAKGFTNAKVASGLGISPRTVEVHRAHLMRKLRLRNPAGLVRIALKHQTPNKEVG
jgi:two-component system, NarL family, response regulator NreC